MAIFAHVCMSGDKEWGWCGGEFKRCYREWLWAVNGSVSRCWEWQLPSDLTLHFNIFPPLTYPSVLSIYPSSQSPIHLTTPCIHTLMYLPLHPASHPPTHPTINLRIQLPTHPSSTHSFVHLPIHLCNLICPSAYMPIHPATGPPPHPPTHLSIHPFTHQSVCAHLPPPSSIMHVVMINGSSGNVLLFFTPSVLLNVFGCP